MILSDEFFVFGLQWSDSEDANFYIWLEIILIQDWKQDSEERFEVGIEFMKILWVG